MVMAWLYPADAEPGFYRPMRDDDRLLAAVHDMRSRRMKKVAASRPRARGKFVKRAAS